LRRTGISHKVSDAYDPPVVRDAEDDVPVVAEGFQVRVREGGDVFDELSFLLLGGIGEFLLKLAVGRLVGGFGY